MLDDAISCIHTNKSIAINHTTNNYVRCVAINRIVLAMSSEFSQVQTIASESLLEITHDIQNKENFISNCLSSSIAGLLDIQGVWFDSLLYFVRNLKDADLLELSTSVLMSRYPAEAAEAFRSDYLYASENYRLGIIKAIQMLSAESTAYIILMQYSFENDQSVVVQSEAAHWLAVRKRYQPALDFLASELANYRFPISSEDWSDEEAEYYHRLELYAVSLSKLRHPAGESMVKKILQSELRREYILPMLK